MDSSTPKSENLRADNYFAIIPEWVLQLPVSASAIRLYAILRRYADNETNECFPSRRTLAKRTKTSLATVDRALKELVDHGALSVHHRRGETGAWSSNLYTLRTTSPLSSQTTRPTLRNEDTPMVKSDTQTRTSVKQNQVTKQFDLFWQNYPKKVGKAGAVTAYEKVLKKVGAPTEEELIEAARRYAEDPKRSVDYTCLATTWLNQGRWDAYLEADTAPKERRHNFSNYESALSMAGSFRLMGRTRSEVDDWVLANLSQAPDYVREEFFRIYEWRG